MLNNTDVPLRDTRARTPAKQYAPSAIITHIVYLKGTQVPVDPIAIRVRFIALSPIIFIRLGARPVIICP